MSRLCIVRHALAVDRGTPGYEDDGLRPLTPEGREKMQWNALGLRELFTPAAILSSPLVRARQTADILCGVYPEAELRFSEALATGDHDALLDDVRGTRREAVAVVGHEPFLSGLLSYTLTADGDAMQTVLKKGAAALVGFSDDAVAGAGWLEWLLQPAALRMVAEGVPGQATKKRSRG
jgi:phosphohistidine phosphatase